MCKKTKHYCFCCAVDLGLYFNLIECDKMTGSFKKRATRASEWTTMAATNAAEVMLMWNWFEFLIKEIVVYQGNYKICTNNEAVQIWPLLNAYLYANMEPMSCVPIPKIRPTACPPKTPRGILTATSGKNTVR